jgi:hypothetical protein
VSTPPAVEHWLAGLRIPGRPDELEGKELLGRYGIAVPAGRRLPPEASEPPAGGGSAARGSGAADPLDALGPLPPSPMGIWVLKVCSAEILHKTESGGVMAGLHRRELSEAVGLMRRRFPGMDLLLEEQVRHAGIELIIGALDDPVLGVAIMAGAGGILTELYQDVSFRLAPGSREECRRMLGELTISPVLRGYRGIAMDVDALAATVSRVGCIAVDLGPRFHQLDVNPVVFASGRWVALDAKILLRPDGSGPFGPPSP